MLTAIVTGSELVKGSPGKVYWISISMASAVLLLTFGLADGLTAGLTSNPLLSINFGSTVKHLVFDPPKEFETGIYANIAGTGSVKATIAYE